MSRAADFRVYDTKEELMMKQRLFAVLLVFCMMAALVPAVALTGAAAGTVSTWDGTVATAFADDSAGTEDDPIEIRSAAEFMYFRNTAAGTATAETYYRLTVDVNLASKNVTAAPAAFAGVFDGNGNTVSNWQNGATGSIGLFGTVTGTVKNLKVDGVVNKKTVAQFGTIAAELGEGGLISDCHVSGVNLSAGVIQNYLGGIVGSISGKATVQNCSVAVAEGTTLKKNNTAAVFYKQGVGGIVGGITVPADTPVSIINCKNTATIASANNSLGGSCGGIVGAIGNAKGASISEVNIINCTNEGNVSADLTTPKKQMEAGGLVGGMYRVLKLNIRNSVNNGDVTAATGIAGGLVGGAAVGTGAGSTAITIASSVNRGAVTALKTGAYAGGLVGGAKTEDAGNIQIYVDVQNSASLGSVTTTDGVSGGIVGSLGKYAGDGGSTAGGFSIRGSYVNAAVTAGAAGTAGLVCGDMNLSSGSGIAADVSGVLAMGTVTGATVGAVVGSSATALKVTDTYYSGVADLPLVAAGTAVTTDTATDADFSGTTVLDALNAAAVAAALPEDTWVKGQASGKPELKLFCTDPVEEPDAPAITIDGASLTISGNVTLNLYVKGETLAAVGVTTFEKIYVVSDKGSYEGVLNGENYTFTIKDLTAKEFGENKEYAVQYTTADAPDTRVTSTETVEYSPLQYAVNMYGTRPEMTTLDPLLLSIVAYADAAGATGAKSAFTAAHADADFGTLPAYATILAGDTAKDTYTYDADTMPRFAAKLTETVTLKLALNGTAYTDVSATIAGANLDVVKNDATGEVTISGLYATDLYNTITFTFTGGEGAEPVTATYSLMQYLNSYAGNETYGALAQATAVYLYAARNFCLANRA